MSGIYDDKNRQVLPRWYPFGTACGMGDIEPATPHVSQVPFPRQLLDDKIHAWREKRTAYHAVDLVGMALIIGEATLTDAFDAANFILSSESSVPALTREIAEVYLSDPTSNIEPNTKLEKKSVGSRLEIAHLKAKVRHYQYNAIVWADLAFYYTLLGQTHKAERCMTIALALGPDNRFILRSAARCFLHLGNSDKALFHLRQSEQSAYDPWLASAEIAIAEGVGERPRLIKAASHLVVDCNLSAWSRNELAATLGTLEWKHGSTKQSRRLFAQALAEPNENTIAQAEWLSEAQGREAVRPEKPVFAPYEANARHDFREGEYALALRNAERWFEYQPFTSRPAILASYIASVCLRDDQEAVRIIERARVSSPDNFLLQNNYAFSLASLDRPVEAELALSSVRQSELDNRERLILQATTGLIEFRRGYADVGRVLYRDAIAAFKVHRQFREAAIAALFWAREEARIHSTFASHALHEARELGAKQGAKEVLDYLSSLPIGT